MGAKGINNPIRAMIQTGTYTGNGADDRTIDVGVDLTAKQNVYVIVKGNVSENCIHRIEYAQGDLGMRYSQADIADRIQQFVATGFEVGADNSVNQNTCVYRYIVFWQEP